MPAPAPIQVLSDAVINKIAAGEVVDRPASVIKELVENALDAGATQVDVEVVAGGRTLLRVADNGGGMDRDNALLSVERHATSKIRDVHDIERIATLGFRGEALAAIASVSRFELLTRPADALGGTEILIQGGRIQEVRDAGGPPGTQITVRQLFFNVPARRKFLRTDATELAHVRQVYLLYALAHPEAGFSLKVDEREVSRLPAAADLPQRLRELFSGTFVDGLLPLGLEGGGMNAEGFTSLPAVSRPDRNDQYVFINRRPCSAPAIHYAINEAYHTLLPRGRHPALFLFLTIPPGEVDVNVHPTKREVRFRQVGAVRDLTLNALREALRQPGRAATPGGSTSGTPPRPDALPPPSQLSLAVQPPLPISDLPPARTFAYPRRVQPPLPEEPAAPSAAADGTAPPPAPAPKSPWLWCRVLGQIGGLFVVLETEEGMVLLDPHAAHERVLFEKFMKELLARDVQAQGLLSPETVELPPDQASRVRRHLTELRAMGFGVAEFGGDTFVVDAVPVCLGFMDIPMLLRDVAQTLEQGGARGGVERWAEAAIAQAACRAAVKARDRLTVAEIEQLILDLAVAEMPYTCPHGRPTMVMFSTRELYRRFGRLGG